MRHAAHMEGLKNAHKILVWKHGRDHLGDLGKNGLNSGPMVSFVNIAMDHQDPKMQEISWESE